jgi:Predicted hydrolase (HAD superfamily)
LLSIDSKETTLSELADFARELHENASEYYDRELIAVPFESRSEKLQDVRAVICDVYGTMFNYWKPEFANPDRRQYALLGAFREVADKFGMTPYLSTMNPQESPEKTLNDFYHGLIALQHEKAAKKDIAYPEIKIEEVWSIIILMLKRHGYDPAQHSPGSPDDLARYVAFTYNFRSLGRQLYPGIVTALTELKNNNMVLGILSNAQFYTKIDLTLLLRDQSGGKIDDYNELFDPDLTFFSYEYKIAKPNQFLFRKLFDALYEYHILPGQTVFVGNDLMIDIKPAQEAGMMTALYTGDREVLFTHELEGQIVPDIVFSDWEELPHMLSFFSGRKADL